MAGINYSYCGLNLHLQITRNIRQITSFEHATRNIVVDLQKKTRDSTGCYLQIFGFIRH